MQPVTGIQGVHKTQKKELPSRQTYLVVELLFQISTIPLRLGEGGTSSWVLMCLLGEASSAWEPRHVTAGLQHAQCSMSRKVLVSPVLQCCASYPNWSVFHGGHAYSDRERRRRMGFSCLCCHSGRLARNIASLLFRP